MALYSEPIETGNKLQVFWDDYIVDLQQTTARLELHHPVYAGLTMLWDQPWEGDGSEAPYILKDTDNDGNPLYRMYYTGWSISNDYLIPEKQVYPLRLYICYAESRDDISWTRPDLGIHELNGSKHNNIVLTMTQVRGSGVLGVFKDNNPDCLLEERYKGVSTFGETDYDTMGCYVSPDGIHFKAKYPLVKKDGRSVMFDTFLNGFWWPKDNRYHFYLRGNRSIEQTDSTFSDLEIRQIRHASSTNLSGYIQSVPVNYASADGGEPPEYPMYTNCVFPYPRNPDILVGFPTRYNQRAFWNDAYDHLPDRDKRFFRYKFKEERFGLALTDCLFMCSRNGQDFFRYDEAFMRPGPERHTGWTYGSCYPGTGLIETPAADGSETEYSIYVPTGHWIGEPVKLERYTIRKDGFASRQATFRGQKVVTKPLVFHGDSLYLNFSTSGRGYIQVILHDAEQSEPILSQHMFGDSTDRIVPFEKDILRKYAGQKVVIEFDMYDADIFAFRFD